jgi:hypothetical protein
MNVEFNLVKDDLPILKDDILRRPFLTNNKVVIDICNNIILINNKNKCNMLKNDEEYFSLNSRTETIVELPIAEPNVEDKNIIIQKQEIIKDVFYNNVIGKVKNGKIIVSKHFKHIGKSAKD